MSNAAVFLGGTSSSVAAAGALGGDGSIGDPLTVEVDGSTVSVSGGNTLQALGVIADLTMVTGKAVRTDTTNAHTALLQAYDVDGTAYKTFATLTNGNTPDLTIGPPAGGTVTVQASTFKSSDGSSGASSTGAYTVITSITVKNGLITAITGS